MSGITSVQFRFMIPSAATGGNAVTFYVRQSATGAIGPNWQASADGHFLVVDGHGDDTMNKLDTGILWTPGTYQTVRVDINTATGTWDFFVNGVKYNAPHPLHYRDAPTFLDQIDILNEIDSPNGSYVDAVTVTRRNLVTIGSASTATVGGVTVVTLSGFSGSQTSFGSLADGRYALTVSANQVTANGQQLDGNGDGTPGDDFVYADSGTTSGNQLYRLFGDGNGDRAVNGLDINLFVAQFGMVGPSLAFDSNGDGAVNGLDITPFVNNFGKTV